MARFTLGQSLVAVRVAALQCRVCHQLFSTYRRDVEGKRVGLFGVVNYAFCPCCLQEVATPGNRDQNYRRRYRRYVQRMLAAGAVVDPPPDAA